MHPMPSGLPPFGFHSIFDTWSLRPGWLVVCLLLLGLYLVGLVRARSFAPAPVGPLRIGCFVTGLVVLYVSVGSGLSTYGAVLFYAHMIEHLLLVMVVPTLLVLGHPLTVLRAVGGETGAARFDRVVSTLPGRVLLHPGFGLAAYAVVIIGTHLTGFMDATMSGNGLPALEEAVYVVGGYLLMQALIGVEPLPTTLTWGPRLFLSVVAMLPDTIVGIVLMQTDVNLFPSMEAMRPSWAPSALGDIHAGGGLMWALGDGLMMVVSTGLIIALIADPRRDRMLGSWLESARQGAFDARVGVQVRADGSVAAGEAADLDDDEDSLAAYNRMLGRLNGDGR